MSTKTYIAITKGDNRRARVCAILTLQYSQERIFAIESNSEQAIPLAIAVSHYCKATTDPFTTSYFVRPELNPDTKVIFVKRRDIKETLYETV